MFFDLFKQNVQPSGHRQKRMWKRIPTITLIMIIVNMRITVTVTEIRATATAAQRPEQGICRILQGLVNIFRQTQTTMLF